MNFKISYQTKTDAANPNSNFAHIIFAEHETSPTPEMVQRLLHRLNKSDFDAKTIEIEELLKIDSEDIKFMGGLHRF